MGRKAIIYVNRRSNVCEHVRVQHGRKYRCWLTTAGSVTLARRFHIGDTPMDLRAAEGAGAQGVGVTTGIFTREELKAASPGVRLGPPELCCGQLFTSQIIIKGVLLAAWVARDCGPCRRCICPLCNIVKR